MKKSISCLLFVMAIGLPSYCLSQNSANFTFVPSPEYSAHQYGVETSITGNNRFGILAANKSDSKRPTYGESNDQVRNDFRRVLSLWSFTTNGAWQDGFVVTAVAGVEKDNFKSTQGSRAEVDFLALGVLAGYQWFWPNGFNITTSAGQALLIANNVKKDIAENENEEVVAYLDKNTKTNTHIGIGLIFGWAF